MVATTIKTKEDIISRILEAKVITITTRIVSGKLETNMVNNLMVVDIKSVNIIIISIVIIISTTVVVTTNQTDTTYHKGSIPVTVILQEEEVVTTHKVDTMFPNNTRITKAITK